ncbi:hypothetical protein OHS18_48420 [Amycolatopsis sp. NBC_00355]|uniref:hypothetical protein n=1 Tax=Amycolatopsis sp. NBC_00355 TaxID=2975957 RepID=UPI002E254A3E
MAVLSAPDGGPLTRTVKKIIDPLVIRTAAHPRLGRPLLDEQPAAELTKLLLADAPRLRATAEWFTHLKKQRRALRITAGNVQDVCFPLAYELATGFGTPGPEAAETAAAALRDLHGEAGATGADELTGYLADPRVAADLTRELHRRWQAATPAATPDDVPARTGEGPEPVRSRAKSATRPDGVVARAGETAGRAAGGVTVPGGVPAHIGESADRVVESAVGPGGVAGPGGEHADRAAWPGGAAAQAGDSDRIARSAGGAADLAGDTADRAEESACGAADLAGESADRTARSAGESADWTARSAGGSAVLAGETAGRAEESVGGAAVLAGETSDWTAESVGGAAALAGETADWTARSAGGSAALAGETAGRAEESAGGTAGPAGERAMPCREDVAALPHRTDATLGDTFSPLAVFVETLTDAAWRDLVKSAAGHALGLALRQPGGSAAVGRVVQEISGVTTPDLGLQRGDRTTVPPLSRRDEPGAELLERSVERRVRATLRRTPADERAPVTELVDDELSRVAAGFGLGLPALAGCFALGVVVAPALRPLDGVASAAVPEFARRLNAQVAREGYVLHARRALAGDTPLTPRPDPELVRELREFAKQFLGRLWIRLHGFDVRGETPADAGDVRDLVTGVVRSTSLDLRTKVRRALVARLPELEAAS